MIARCTCMKFVVGESVIRKGGGGESTSSSGETEHDRDANLDCDELRDLDFGLFSLKLDEKSDTGDIFS